MIKHHSKEHNKKISDTCKLRHINVKHGLSMIQHYCKDCKRKITWRALQCASCFAKERFSNPKNHPSYIDGRCTKLHYCIDCKKQSISLTGWRGQGRCAKCSRVYNMKTMMQKQTTPNMNNMMKKQTFNIPKFGKYKFMQEKKKQNNIYINHENKSYNTEEKKMDINKLLPKKKIWGARE